MKCKASFPVPRSRSPFQFYVPRSRNQEPERGTGNGNVERGTPIYLVVRYAPTIIKTAPETFMISSGFTGEPRKP